MILSVSQVEAFDSTQRAGCPRRWYFERVEGHKPEQTDAQTDGVAGHALLATYLATGQTPEGRVKMGKAVRAAIAKGVLPAPGPDLLIERRFSGQDQRTPDGKWIPVDVSKTLHIGRVPWDGFIDCLHGRDVVTVLDHKFTSDLEYAKQGAELINTVQMPVYALAALKWFPGATQFRLSHHYVCRTGEESDLRSALVTLDQVTERKAAIETTVASMQQIKTCTSQADVPFNRKACDAFGGCPHQSRCTAFKQRSVMLTPEELALFSDLPSVPAKAPASAPGAPAAPVQISDSEEVWDPAKKAFSPVAAPAPAPVTDHRAAIIPAAAPIEDPALPPPEKAKRGRKKTDKAIMEEIAKTTDMKAATTFTEESTRGVEGLLNGAVSADPVVSDVASDSRVSSAAPTYPLAIGYAPSVTRVVVELGPETLAALRALLTR